MFSIDSGYQARFLPLASLHVAIECFYLEHNVLQYRNSLFHAYFLARQNVSYLKQVVDAEVVFGGGLEKDSVDLFCKPLSLFQCHCSLTLESEELSSTSSVQASGFIKPKLGAFFFLIHISRAMQQFMCNDNS